MSNIFHPISRTRIAIATVLFTATVTPCFAQAQITPRMRSEARAVMQACRADYDHLCGEVAPGGGRILACLQSHAGQLTSSCAQAMPRAQALRDSAVSAGVAPK
jgi:hypothetical protein